jgi:hypothetical protein
LTAAAAVATLVLFGQPRHGSAAAGGGVMVRPSDPVAEALDGATGDYAVSGDAMRWSPELAETPAHSGADELAGLDVASGFGSVLGFDGAGVRRRVTGALVSLTSAAGDVVHELRQLTRGQTSEDDAGDP